MRAKYWSHSRLARWIKDRVGVGNPKSLSMEGWDEWKKDYEEKNKFAYWFTEEFLGNLQDIVYWPYDRIRDCKSYLRNRYVDKPHYLNTKLKPGKYYEVDTRMLYGLFETLVDFVECEKAHMQLICHSDEERPWWYDHFLTRWKSIRSKELGFKYLEWEAALGEENKNQSEKAQEVIDLYNWWTEDRPKRVDPHDESGWSAYCDEKRDEGCMFHTEKDDEGRARVRKMLNRISELETQYEEEDTEMLIRLIKIRRGLWT